MAQTTEKKCFEAVICIGISQKNGFSMLYVTKQVNKEK